jgi:hypothetical protein
MAMGLRNIFRARPAAEAEQPVERAPDPVDLDRMLVDELRKFGADLGQPRDARFFLYFHDHGDAERAEFAIREEGFATLIEETELDRDEQWRLIAWREMVVDDDAIAEVRRVFGRIALANWGSFGGWEAAATD